MIVSLNMNITDEDDRIIAIGSRVMNLTYESMDELSDIFNNAGMDFIDGDLMEALENNEVKE